MQALLAKLCAAALAPAACELVLASDAHPASKLRSLVVIGQRVCDPGALWGTPVVEALEALASSSSDRDASAAQDFAVAVPGEHQVTDLASDCAD